MNKIGFIQDKTWNKAKKAVGNAGLADNWAEVISYYYYLGGNHVLLYTAIEGVRYRILQITDQEEILLEDMNKNLVLEDYEAIYESRKQFYYNEEPLNKKVIELPEDITVNNKNSVTILEK